MKTKSANRMLEGIPSGYVMGDAYGPEQPFKSFLFSMSAWKGGE